MAKIAVVSADSAKSLKDGILRCYIFIIDLLESHTIIVEEEMRFRLTIPRDFGELPCVTVPG